MSNRFLYTAAATVLAAGALVVPAPAASAAPDCAKVEHWTGRITQTVQVTNNCRRTISFKVRRTNGPDSQCALVEPGKAVYFQWARYGSKWEGITWDCV